MKKTIFLFILLMLCWDITLAQEKSNYFPLAVGNRWEYDCSSNNCYYIYEITRDTIMENGKKYFITESQSPYNRNPIFLWQYPKRVDEKGDVYMYDTLTNEECLYYRFSELGEYCDCDPLGYLEFGIGSVLYTTIKINDYSALESYYLDGDTNRIAIIYSPIEPNILIFKKNVGLIYLASNPRLELPPVHTLGRAVIDGEEVYRLPNYTVDIGNPIPTLPTDIQLHQNYPNPFNPSTKIEYSLPEASMVRLSIYNTLGQEVATLVNSNQATGKYSVDFNATNLSSGIYFYRLQSDKFNAVKKMMLVK